MTDDDVDAPRDGAGHGEAAGGAGHGEAAGGAGHGEAAGGAGAGARGAGGGADSDATGELPEALAVVQDLADRAAAGAGFVVAAFALLAALLPWTESPPLVPAVAGAGSTIGAALALVATAAFFARRHGHIDRRPGAALAGVACAGVLATAAVRFVAPAAGGGSDPVVGVGLPLALVAATLGVALAVADATAVSPAGLLGRARRTAVAFLLVVGAFVVMAVVSSPLADVELSPTTGIVVAVVLADVVFAAVALTFLQATGRGLAFVDVELPGLLDVVYTVVGFVGLFVLLIALRLVTLALELPTTPNRITEAARQGNPETLLVLVPLSFLLVAPAEELLNRNVIQKYLYGTFSRPGAVVVASLVFASAHVFSYSGDTVVGMAVSLVSVFLLSLVLGAIYERTENILVPVAVHGAFNAVQFLLLYVAIVYADALEQQAAALPW